MKINTFKKFYHHAVRAFEANIEGLIYLRLLGQIPKEIIELELKNEFEVYAYMVNNGFKAYQEKIFKMKSQINNQESNQIIGVVGKFENTLNELEAQRLENSIDFPNYAQQIETAFFEYKKDSNNLMQNLVDTLINRRKKKNASKTGKSNA